MSSRKVKCSILKQGEIKTVKYYNTHVTNILKPDLCMYIILVRTIRTSVCVGAHFIYCQVPLAAILELH